jgi:hypothetical protein
MKWSREIHFLHDRIDAVSCQEKNHNFVSKDKYITYDISSIWQ